MKRAAVLIGLIFGGIVMPSAELAAAAERALVPPPGNAQALPFARSPGAESVWASGACWSQCQSICTRDLFSCLQFDSQGRCLKHTDACDRACQRDCRSRGGPYLPIE
jgi:hypothetical protein